MSMSIDEWTTEGTGFIAVDNEWISGRTKTKYMCASESPLSSIPFERGLGNINRQIGHSVETSHPELGEGK